MGQMCLLSLQLLWRAVQTCILDMCWESPSVEALSFLWLFGAWADCLLRCCELLSCKPVCTAMIHSYRGERTGRRRHSPFEHVRLWQVCICCKHARQNFISIEMFIICLQGNPSVVLSANLWQGCNLASI